MVVVSSIRIKIVTNNKIIISRTVKISEILLKIIKIVKNVSFVD